VSVLTYTTAVIVAEPAAAAVVVVVAVQSPFQLCFVSGITRTLLTELHRFIHTKYTIRLLSYELHKLLWVLRDLTAICDTVSMGNKDRNEGFKNELYENSLFADCVHIHAVITINFTKYTHVTRLNFTHYI